MAEGPTWDEIARLLDEYGDGDERAIARRLTELRLRHDPPLTIEDLAARLDGRVRLDRSAIWKIENPDKPRGGRKVTLSEGLALAKALDVTIVQLLLPTDALQEVDGWLHFAAAAEALNDMRHASGTYRDEIDTVRLRIQARPELAIRIRSYQSEAHERFADLWRPVWENDHEGKLHSEAEFKAFLREQLPTPAMVAAADALGDYQLRIDQWFSTKGDTK